MAFTTWTTTKYMSIALKWYFDIAIKRLSSNRKTSHILISAHLSPPDYMYDATASLPVHLLSTTAVKLPLDLDSIYTPHLDRYLG